MIGVMLSAFIGLGFFVISRYVGTVNRPGPPRLINSMVSCGLGWPERRRASSGQLGFISPATTPAMYSSIGISSFLSSSLMYTVIVGSLAKFLTVPFLVPGHPDYQSQAPPAANSATAATVLVLRSLRSMFRSAPSVFSVVALSAGIVFPL